MTNISHPFTNREISDYVTVSVYNSVPNGEVTLMTQYWSITTYLGPGTDSEYTEYWYVNGVQTRYS
jgi:hypothetical protein